MGLGIVRILRVSREAIFCQLPMVLTRHIYSVRQVHSNTRMSPTPPMCWLVMAARDSSPIVHLQVLFRVHLYQPAPSFLNLPP